MAPSDAQGTRNSFRTTRQLCQHIAEAAETVGKMERDDNGWIFFRVSVYTLNEEPTSDADVLSHLTYRGAARYYELKRRAQ